MDDYTYQRRDNVVRVGLNIDSIANVNYVFYQNTNYTNKWFYAFVTKLEYISDNRTDLHIETDVLQTWQFDLTYKPSFVEREHVTVDTPGLHTIEEGIEFGEYVYQGSGQLAGLHHLCILVTMNVENVAPWDPVVGTLQDGIYHACAYYYYPATVAGALALSTMLNALDGAGKSASVVSINMFPSLLMSAFLTGARVPSNVATLYEMIEVNRKASGEFIDFEGVYYQPKNNKLYCYPYNFLSVTNRTGGMMKYRYEWFREAENGKINFKLLTNPGPQSVVYAIPQLYRFGGQPHTADNDNWDEALIMGGYPLCDWNSDVFKNWLAQNAVNLGVGVAGSALAIGVGISTANPVAVASGVLGVASVLGQAYEKSVLPAGVNGSSSSADTKCALGAMDIAFYPMSITVEYMRRLDQYFEMFGYKVTAVKVPNLTGRPVWNYVKTVDINITGNIPDEDMTKIKTLYNEGVTIWHSPSTFLDYTQDNH